MYYNNKVWFSRSTLKENSKHIFQKWVLSLSITLIKNLTSLANLVSRYIKKKISISQYVTIQCNKNVAPYFGCGIVFYL